MFDLPDTAVEALENIDKRPRMYGLPLGYRKLTKAQRKAARMRSLTSWFDRKHPQELCTDVEKMIKAERLWVDFYMKPAECNAHIYFYPDPKHKYDMVRMAMLPPKQPTEPSKSCVHAPRNSAKTITLITEMMTNIAINRPSTKMLLCEANTPRTGEEMCNIR